MILKLSLLHIDHHNELEVGQKLEIRSVNRQTGEITAETNCTQFLRETDYASRAHKEDSRVMRRWRWFTR